MKGEYQNLHGCSSVHEPGTTSVTNPPSRVCRISCGAIHWRRSSTHESMSVTLE